MKTKARKVYCRNLVLFWIFFAFALLNVCSNLLGLWALWHLSGYFCFLVAAPWTWFHALYTIKVLFENRKKENLKKPLFVAILLAIFILIYGILVLSGLLSSWWWDWLL